MENASIQNKQGESVSESQIVYRFAKSIINFNPSDIVKMKLGDFTLDLDDSGDREFVKKYAQGKGILRRKDSARILERDIRDCPFKNQSKVVLSRISLNDTHPTLCEETVRAWKTILREVKWTLRIHADAPKALSIVDKVQPPFHHKPASHDPKALSSEDKVQPTDVRDRVEICLTLATTAPDQWDMAVIAALKAMAKKGYNISAILTPCHSIKDWKLSLKDLFGRLPELKSVWADCKAITSREKKKKASAFSREKALRLFYSALAEVAGSCHVGFLFVLSHRDRSYWWKKKEGVIPAGDEKTKAPKLADEILSYLRKEGSMSLESKDVAALIGALKHCHKAEIQECEVIYKLCHLGSPNEEKLKERRKHFFTLCSKHWSYSGSHLYRLYHAGEFLSALKKKKPNVAFPKRAAQVTALQMLAKLEDRIGCWDWIAKTTPIDLLRATEIEKEVLLYADREGKELKEGKAPPSSSPSASLESLKRAETALRKDYPHQTELQNALEDLIQKIAVLQSASRQSEKKNDTETNGSPLRERPHGEMLPLC